MSETIAFIGLGNMGLPIARNLLKGGHSLYVYNRHKEKGEPLIKEGAKWLASPEEAFAKANIVFTMVSNDAALEDVSNALLKGVKSGVIHVSMSTVSPDTTEKLAKQYAEKGAMWIAAPVFGRPDAAAAAKLWICMAGEAQAKRKVEPFLKEVGQRVEDFGETPQTANVIKLCGNFLILSAIKALGEVSQVAEKNGIDSSQVINFFAETIFPSPVYKGYGNIIAKGMFEPAGFKMTLGLKDIDLFCKTASKAKLHQPLAELLKSLLEKSIKEGKGDLDWSAVALTH